MAHLVAHGIFARELIASKEVSKWSPGGPLQTPSERRLSNRPQTDLIVSRAPRRTTASPITRNFPLQGRDCLRVFAETVRSFIPAVEILTLPANRAGWIGTIKDCESAPGNTCEEGRRLQTFDPDKIHSYRLSALKRPCRVFGCLLFPRAAGSKPIVSCASLLRKAPDFAANSGL